MLGTQVASDLELDTVHRVIPTTLPWGKHSFEQTIQTPSADSKVLKHAQLPLAALKANTTLNTKLREVLFDISGAASSIDETLSSDDPLASESVGQIFFGNGSLARPLNTNNVYLNLVLFWKTIFLPAFAVLAPLIGILVPFFIFKLFGRPMTVPDYLLHVRGSILKQMSIPQFLKARHEGDRLGGFFESMAVGVALIMFISSIWNQVNAAKHLRSIWDILQGRGSSLNTVLKGAASILETLQSTTGATKRAFRALISEGTAALNGCAALQDKQDIVCSGAIWNSPRILDDLRKWLGRIDMYSAIATLPVCIVKYSDRTGIHIQGLVHPFLSSCVSNNLQSCAHSILTGPNRGGKSTFCKALGLSLITAQTLGFAWADSMTLRPFGAIHTALEPAGKLGYASTFEAEIVFAKAVLDVEAQPLFVMMDEIFHSTNAVDGLRASGVFMDALYAKQECVSLISTHYRDLVTQFATRAAAYQMAANEGPDSLLYTYKITAGVSDKSSVDELLRAHGLLAGPVRSGCVPAQQKNDTAESE